MLVEHTPAAIAILDRDLCYIIASNRWMKDYKLNGKDIVGLCHYDIFPEIRNMPDWLSDHKRVLEGEVITIHEYRWERPDGSTEWLKFQLRPWQDNTGEIGGIVMFTEVITEYKRIEREIREREEVFRTVMERSPIGMALLYPDGTWMKVNQSLCNFLGYTEEELQSTNFQSLTHPDDLEKDLSQVQDLLAGTKSHFQIEKRYVTKFGVPVWALLNATLIHDDHGKPKYFLSEIIDITTQKTIDNIKDDFISLVGHELKTPITSVTLALNLLGDYKPAINDLAFDNLLLLAQRNCARLSDLVTDIVDLNRIKAGLFTYDTETVSLKKLIEQSLSDNAILCQTHGVRFEIGHIDDVHISADPQRLLQVIGNFLSNAAKFSFKGEAVVTSTKISGKTVRVQITDYGAGIPKEFRENVFQKFMRAPQGLERKMEGTGLGLFICKEIIEAMGGEIGFDSTPNESTTFWFSFPVVD